ncbi:MAG TPA: hypothetical protein VKM72_18315 [Thermoanaerobaculia bacterium]|nr:hypothetical protein [Thermoanaerobaculia bacterium]
MHTYRHLRPLLAVFTFLAATATHAQIQPISAETQVPGNPAGFQSAPATAVALSGGALVVWQSANTDGQEMDVLARAYGPDGAPFGPELMVNSYLPDCQQNPDVAAAPDGTFTVVWQSEGQDGSGSGIFVRRFSALGAPLGAEAQVNSTTAGDQRAPRVAHGATGDFVVVWESFGQDGDGWSVVARRFGAAGPLSAEVMVPTSFAGPQRHPDLAFQSAAQVIFAWEAPDGEGSGVFLRRFAATLGSADPAAVRANVSAAGFQSFPRIGVDASGNVIALWEGSSSDGTVIQARRFDRFLAPLGTEVQADAGSSGPATRPAVESAGSGDFLVLWEGWSADQGGPGVVARPFDFLEQPAAAGSLVHVSFPDDQGRPALSASSAGTFFAAWQGQDSDGSGVLIRRFAFLGHDLHTIAPCRILDTRQGTSLVSGLDRVFALSAGLSQCGIPLTARALALNVTVTGSSGAGYVSLFPGDAPPPVASTINFASGQTLANNAIVSLARNGTASLGTRTVAGGGGQVHLIVDSGGYFE